MSKRDVRITIRGFTKDGYHRDFYFANGEQTLMTEMRVTEPTDSMRTGLIGHGAGINPADFPEMVRFEVVIR